MRALGADFDLSIAFTPVDIDTANGFTGKRVSLRGARAISFVFIGGVGGADDLTFDWQQHTAYTGGTTKDLDSDPTTGTTNSRGLTEYYIKAETALDGDEAWVRVPSAAEASELVVSGATYGAQQKMVVSTVEASQLGDGYGWVSVAGSLTTSTSQLATGFYVLSGMRYRRRPDRLGNNWLNPGAVNA